MSCIISFITPFLKRPKFSFLRANKIIFINLCAIICEMFRALVSLCFILAVDELRGKIKEKMTDHFFS